MLNADYCEIQVGGHRRNSKRYIALVDAADAEAVGAYRWSMSSYGYVMRKTGARGKQRDVFLHHSLLGLGPGVPYVDHVSGDKLDNRRQNLRACTQAQNNQNLHHCGPHRGASWHAKSKRWQAQAMLDRKQHYLGLYATQAEAAAVAAAFRREHMPYSADARLSQAYI